MFAQLTLWLDPHHSGEPPHAQASVDGGDWIEGFKDSVVDRDLGSGRERVAQSFIALPGHAERVELRLVDQGGKTVHSWTVLLPQVEMSNLLNTGYGLTDDLSSGACNADPPYLLVDKSWKAMPTRQQTRSALPEAAKTEGFFGRVHLDCLLLDTGSLADCRVGSEWPVDHGLGSAALSLTATYRLDLDQSWSPKPGRRIEVPVLFDWLDEAD